jgi:hypothetical protein
MVIVRWAFGILMGVGILAVGVTALNDGPAGDAGGGAAGDGFGGPALESQGEPPDTGSPDATLALEQALAQQAAQNGARAGSCRRLEGPLLQEVLATIPPGTTLERATTFGDPDGPALVSVELSGPAPPGPVIWATPDSGAGVQLIPANPAAESISAGTSIPLPRSTLQESEICLQAVAP